YWTAPPRGSPAAQAFRAYRDFVGEGGRFEDVFVEAFSFDRLSIFASRDEAASRVVLVAVNARDEPAPVHLRLAGCGQMAGVRQFTTRGGPFERKDLPAPETVLEPQSITVLE